VVLRWWGGRPGKGDVKYVCMSVRDDELLWCCAVLCYSRLELDVYYVSLAAICC
jgi:hypothetical protein